MTISTRTNVKPTRGAELNETVSTPPLVETLRPARGAAPPTEPVSAEVLLGVGRPALSKGIDPLAARASIESLTLALEGARIKAQKLADGRSGPEKIDKLISVLKHAVAQATRARESTDVLLLRGHKPFEDSIQKLTAGYAGLLSALSGALLEIDPFGPEGAAQRKETAALMQQLEQVLTSGIEMRAASSWWNAANTKRELPVTAGQIYPLLDRGQSVPDEAVLHHLKAESFWAQGKHGEAAHELWLAATAIEADQISNWKKANPNWSQMRPPPLQPALGVALLNLADALTASGLESAAITGPSKGGDKTTMIENRFDPVPLYFAAAGSVIVRQREGGFGHGDEVVGRVLNRVIAGLHQLGEPEAAAHIAQLEEGREVPPLKDERDPIEIATRWSGDSVRVQFLYPSAWSKWSF